MGGEKLSNNKKLKNILSVTKISIIIFIMIIVYVHSSQYWQSMNIEFNGQFNIYTGLLSLILTLSSYILWLIVSKDSEQSSNIFKLKWLIETLFFMVIISIPIYVFSEYESEYKYIFLLLIISSTIQYGSKYGIITSLISSIVILGSDLVYALTEDGINIFFQRDIIMTGVFIVVAWVLGYYVDLIADENQEKENRLYFLSNKLEEKDKQKEEMKNMIINNELCYDILFENSINAVVVHKNGKILYANKSAINLLAYDYIDYFDEKTIYEFYDKKEIESIKQKYCQIENEKKAKVIEEEIIIDAFGKSKPVKNISSFFLYKEENAVLSVLTDMTNEKEIESLKLDMQKNIKVLNETKEFNVLIRNFFINMSHELKTPVNVIYSAIQALNMDFEQNDMKNLSKHKGYLKSMKQNCLRIIRLINNFVDTTRLEAGEFKINKENADIVNVIEGVVEKIAEFIKEKDIQVIFDTNVEEKIMAFDQDAIKRILLNIISNSIKFGFKKEKICINLISTDEKVVIKIRDNGKGIAKSKMNFIFERFGQADNSLSRECEGCGIGLYIVKSLVELHDGNIKVISNEGAGTEVIIKLPCQVIKDSKYSNRIIIETDEEKIEREFSDIYTI